LKHRNDRNDRFHNDANKNSIYLTQCTNFSLSGVIILIIFGFYKNKIKNKMRNKRFSNGHEIL